MGSIEIRIDKESLETDFQNKADQISTKATDLLDEIAEIYKDYMVDLTPERTGETKKQTIIESIGDTFRAIFSTVPWWDALVGGHAVFGPIFSERQRRWWFWYLNTVLGGEYTNKTSGYKGGDDYPLEAFYNAESDVDSKLDEFMEWLIE